MDLKLKRKYGNMKGQVALEYLMTYGWAVFLLIIVVGIIAFYTSSLSSGTVREECIFPQQIICNAVVAIDGSPVGEPANDVDEFRINITNNFDTPIRVTSLYIEYPPKGKVQIFGGEELMYEGDSKVFKKVSRDLGFDVTSGVSAKLYIEYNPCSYRDDGSVECFEDYSLSITGFVSFRPIRLQGQAQPGSSGGGTGAG